MEKKNNKGLIILIVFLVLVVIGLASIIVIDKLNNSDKTNDNKITENEDKKDELKEVNIKDYNDLINSVVYNSCGNINFNLFYNKYTIDNLPTDYMLEAAILSTSSIEYDIDEDTAKELNYVGYMYDSYKKYKNENKTESGIPRTSIKTTVKKLFNKDIEIAKGTSIRFFRYISKYDAYFGRHLCGPSFTTNLYNYKAEKDGNELYIYTKIYAENYADDMDSTALYDFGKLELEKANEQEITSISFDKSTPIEKISNDNKIGNLDIENYIKQNLDKFTTYKFTFKLIDGNYIYQKFEKM